MALASRGLRDMDEGPDPLPVDEARIVRRQAARVHRRAFAAALLVTLVAWLLP